MTMSAKRLRIETGRPFANPTANSPEGFQEMTIKITGPAVLVGAAVSALYMLGGDKVWGALLAAWDAPARMFADPATPSWMRWYLIAATCLVMVAAALVVVRFAIRLARGEEFL
jgi:hypothetical protein